MTFCKSGKKNRETIKHIKNYQLQKIRVGFFKITSLLLLHSSIHPSPKTHLQNTKSLVLRVGEFRIPGNWPKLWHCELSHDLAPTTNHLGERWVKIIGPRTEKSMACRYFNSVFSTLFDMSVFVYIFCFFSLSLKQFYWICWLLSSLLDTSDYIDFKKSTVLQLQTTYRIEMHQHFHPR